MNLIRYRKLRKILSAALALILFHESAFVGYRGEWSAQPLTPPNLSAPGYDRQDVQPHFDRANRSRDRYEWDSIMTGARSEVRLAWEQTVDAQIEAERHAILQSDAIHDADDYRSYIVSELEIQKERALLQWQAALDAEIEAERRAFLMNQAADEQTKQSDNLALWQGVGGNAAQASGAWNADLAAQRERERQRELRDGQQDAEKQWRRELEQALRKAQWDYQAGYGELEDRYLEIQDQLDAREAEFDNNLTQLRQLEQEVRAAIANQVAALRNELNTNSFYHEETCVQSNCTTDPNQLSPAGQELADLLTQLETGLANNAPISTLAQTMATTLANQEAFALQRAANWNTQINGSRNYSITQAGGYFTSTSVDICIPGFGCFPQVTLHPQVPQLAQWVLNGDTAALQNYLQGTETRQITAVTGASFSGSSNYWEGTGLFGEWLGDVARGGANNQSFEACQHTIPAPINCATYNDALYYLKWRFPPPGFGVDHTPEFEENLHYTFSYTYHDDAAETNRDRYAAYGAALGAQHQTWLNDLLPAITNWETQLAAYEASYGAWLGEAAQIRADADSAFQVGMTELRGAYIAELQRLDNLRVEGEDFWHKANETRRANEKRAESELQQQGLVGADLRRALAEKAAQTLEEFRRKAPRIEGSDAIEQTAQRALATLPVLTDEFLNRSRQGLPDTQGLIQTVEAFDTALTGLLNLSYARTAETKLIQQRLTLIEQTKAQFEARNGEISFLINPPEFDEQLRLQELDYIKKRNGLGHRVENTKYYTAFDQAEYDRLKTELTRKMQEERAKRTDDGFRVEVLPDGTVRMVRSIPAGQTKYIPGKDPEDKNSYTREMTSQIVEVAAPKHAAILTPDELFKKWDNTGGDSYLKSLEAFETTMGQQAQIMQTTLDDAETVAQRNENGHQKRVQESIETAKEQRAMLEGILSNLAGGMSLGKSWSMYHQQQMQSAITGEWADALGLDADVLSAMFGKGSLKSKLTGIVEGRAYNAIGAAIQAATGIPASLFTSTLRKHVANGQKTSLRAKASQLRPAEISTLLTGGGIGFFTYAWRNSQNHEAGQVALQVVETAAAVALNTVGNIFGGAGSATMAAYYAAKQAYLGSLNGGTKGALAGLASGVVSGALTYAVGAYGGAYLGEAAKSVGVNVNASYTFDGGWSGGLGFNFSGIEGKGLGFGANLQFAEGRGAVGGGIDLSFGRGGGRTALTLNSDNTARIGYTTAGSGPQNNLRGNYGVTLDKDGIAGVDASASYTGYHGGSLFGQGTSTTLTNSAGLFYNRDGSYGITTSTNIGIADQLGFGLNRVGSNTNERYMWGPGGGFQGTTQNITTDVGFQSKEQALENIRKRTNEVYALLEKGNPSPEEEAALREELKFLKQRDAQADPWTAMYNTVMARTDIPQSVKDEIRKNPDLLLDHDYMKNVFLSLGEEGGSIPIAGTDRSRNGIIDNVAGAVGDAIDWLGGESSSDLGYVDQNGKFVYRICFVAGTKIRTRDGFKNIEEILEGDYVLSLNEKTGEQRFSRVTQTYIRQADRIYQLTFADGTLIETTWSHPFYIKGKGWIQAKDLRVGDVSVTAARTNLAITGIRVDARYETVYNFTVEDDHNYYVSEAQVLVHNEGYFESKALVWSESARREYLAEKYGTTNLAAIEKEFLEAYDAAHALAYDLALKRTGHLDPDPTGERSAALSQEIESLKASCQTQVCRDAVDRGLTTGHVDGRIMVSVSGSAAANMGYTPMGGGNALIRPRANLPPRSAGANQISFVNHGASRALERGFTNQRINRVINEGTAVESMGRYGPQVRYTLGRNTIVIAKSGRNAGKVISTFSDATVNDVRGHWIDP